MQAELEALEKGLGNPERPVVAIVGGAKVSTKLDLLMNLVGELVTSRGRLTQLAAVSGNDALVEESERASRLIEQLRNEIVTSRMVPVAQVFDRFPRLVRDAARALDKELPGSS